MNHDSPKIRYPRRRFIRGMLRGVNRVLFSLLTHLEVTGQENLPNGPIFIRGTTTPNSDRFPGDGLLSDKAVHVVKICPHDTDNTGWR
jgi:hypothetical protein